MGKFEAILSLPQQERHGVEHNDGFLHLEYIGVNRDNVSGRSDKFWCGWTEGNEMVVKFGKRGTPGQVRRKPFNTKLGAQMHLEDKKREKMKDGYKPVKT